MDFFTIAKFHYRDIHICNFFLRKLVNIQPVMWFKIKPLRTHDVICQKKYFLILELYEIDDFIKKSAFPENVLDFFA